MADYKPETDTPDLARGIDAWPRLPEAVEAGILAMAGTSRYHRTVGFY